MVVSNPHLSPSSDHEPAPSPSRADGTGDGQQSEKSGQKRKGRDSTSVMEAADTDWLMYGLALLEVPSMANKHVLLHKSFKARQGSGYLHDYLNVNAVLTALHRFVQQQPERTSAMCQPAVQLLFIYIMSGTDYVPGFYNISLLQWIKLYLEYYRLFVAVPNARIGQKEPPPTPDEPLVSYTEGEGGELAVTISLDAAERFISAMYYTKADKKRKLLARTPLSIADVFRELRAANRQANVEQALAEQLYCNYSFARRLMAGPCLHGWTWSDGSSYARFLEDTAILPEAKSVNLQAKRCMYVVHLVLEALCEAPSSIRNCHVDFGWCEGPEGAVSIDWGAADSPVPVSSERAAGTAGERRGVSDSGVLGPAAAPEPAGRARVSARGGCACKAGKCVSLRCGCRKKGTACGPACKCISCQNTCQHAHAAASASSEDDLEPMDDQDTEEEELQEVPADAAAAQAEAAGAPGATAEASAGERQIAAEDDMGSDISLYSVRAADLEGEEAWDELYSDIASLPGEGNDSCGSDWSGEDDESTTGHRAMQSSQTTSQRARQEAWAC